MIRRESDTGHPVSVAIILDGILALGEGVPQLDGLISGPRHDLTIVHWEGNGEDILYNKMDLLDYF